MGDDTASYEATTRREAERCIARQRRLEDERRWRRIKWGVASCDDQMAKKRSRQSREAE